jgi:outer membrane immunogenic protein
MKSILLATTVLMGLSGGAFAADVVAQLPVASTYDWTGAYVGAHIGGGWDHVDWAYVGGPDRSHNGSGVLGGLQIGYNFQNDNIVYGVEADISAADVHGSTACPNASWSCGSKIDMLGSVRGRLGWAMDKLLIYGTGGLGYGTVDIRTVDSGGDVFGTKKTKAGWTVGAGAEYAFNPHWTVKAEYKYFDLSRSSDYVVDGGQLVTAKPRIHTAVIGLNYKF